MIKLTPEEKSAIIEGLMIKCALIETGNPHLRAVDVQNGHKGTIRALDTNQMRMIIMYTDLIKKVADTSC